MSKEEMIAMLYRIREYLRYVATEDYTAYDKVREISSVIEALEEN